MLVATKKYTDKSNFRKERFILGRQRSKNLKQLAMICPQSGACPVIFFQPTQSLSLWEHKINDSCGWDKKLGFKETLSVALGGKKLHCTQLLNVFPKKFSILKVPCSVVLKDPLKVPRSNLIFLKPLAATLLGSPGSTEAARHIYKAAPRWCAAGSAV